ncbi:Uncharacterized protein FWK35_00024835, partial [Aphis craccivora]
CARPISRYQIRLAKKNPNGKRLISTPGQTGGAIPLIPIFAGLSALGSLMSGSASVYNAIAIDTNHAYLLWAFKSPSVDNVNKNKKRWQMGVALLSSKLQMSHCNGLY